MDDPKDQETRDRIITLATGLFYSQGLEKTPIQKIIDGVGIAKGTFYHHFKSKEDLVAVVLDRLTTRVLDGTADIVNATGLTAHQKLLHLFQRSAAIKLDNLPEALLVLRQMLDSTNPDFMRRIEQAASGRVEPIFCRILTQGQQDGSFNIAYPEETTRMMLAMFMGFRQEVASLTLQAAAGNDLALEQVIRLFTAAEIGLERLLGLAPGSLPIYNVELFVTKIKEVRND
jgi:AcrR family transcriptional regulator